MEEQDQQTATKWKFTIQFPTDSDFVNRITDASFGPSKSSGNPMVTIMSEVQSPKTKEVGGELIDVSGVKTINYYTTINTKDPVKQANAQKKFKELMGLLFPDEPERAENINYANPDLTGIKGKLILTQMSAQSKERRKDPTLAQIQAAKAKNVEPEGDVMTNPRTGEKLIAYQPQINEVFGLHPDSQ